MKKYIAGVMSAIFLFALALPSYAQSYQEEGDSIRITEEMNLQFVAEAAQLSTSNNAVYSTVKQVTDFAGNGYTVVEYSPVGYFIFHNESGKYVEYAERALSPYCGYEENLYYGGPTEYYVKYGETYYHTVLDDVQISSIFESEMAASSEQLNQSFSAEPVAIGGTVLAATTSSVINSYVTNGENFFVGNTSFGYYDHVVLNGTCTGNVKFSV